MNTSLISHRMFVAALANDRHMPEKHLPAGRGVDASGATRNGTAKPSPKTLAALATRPWVNWPFGGVMEEPSAS